MKAFIFIISILTNQGEIEIQAYDVHACPDRTEFPQRMEALKQADKFKAWEAICVERLPGSKGA